MLSLSRGDRGLGRLEVVFFSTAVGMSTVSLYTFGIGVLGFLQSRWLFLVPGAVVAAVGAYRLWRGAAGIAGANWRPGAACENSPGRPKLGPSPDRCASGRNDAAPMRWLWWGVPFTLVIVLAGTLTPFEFDVLEYHLQVPKEFYQQGRIDFLPHNVYGNMPLASEMLSLAAMAALGDWWFGALVGKTVIVLALPSTALGLFAAGRRLVSATSGMVAALVFISIPWVARVSSLGLVEGVSALFLWGTAYAVLLWWRDEAENRMPRTLLVGFLAGTAAACKYPNVIFVLLPAAAVVGIARGAQRTGGNMTMLRPRRPARRGQLGCAPVACFLLAAGIACAVVRQKLGANRQSGLSAGVQHFRRSHAHPGIGRPMAAGPSSAGLWRATGRRLGGERRVAQSLAESLDAAVGPAGRRSARAIAAWLGAGRVCRFSCASGGCLRIASIASGCRLPVLAFLAGLASAQGPFALALAGEVCWRCLAVNLLLIVAGGGGDTSYFVSLPRLLEDPTRVHYWYRYLNEHVAQTKSCSQSGCDRFRSEDAGPLLHGFRPRSFRDR